MKDSSTIEITENDITKYPEIKSNEISVFGIRLGMKKLDLNELESQNENLYFEIEKHYDGSERKDYRIYVYDKHGYGPKEKSIFSWFKRLFNIKRDCILYLIWDENCNDLRRITFYEQFQPYLIGLSKKILTFDSFDINSKISLEYLGNPDDKKVTLDLTSFKLITYFFNLKGMTATLREEDGNKSFQSFGFGCM